MTNSRHVRHLNKQLLIHPDIKFLILTIAVAAVKRNVPLGDASDELIVSMGLE